MTIFRSIALFLATAVLEIGGGAWLVWQGTREHRGWATSHQRVTQAV